MSASDPKRTFERLPPAGAFAFRGPSGIQGSIRSLALGSGEPQAGQTLLLIRVQRGQFPAHCLFSSGTGDWSCFVSPSDSGESLIPVIAPILRMVHCAAALFKKHIRFSSL
jgi:hypothetical protein